MAKIIVTLPNSGKNSKKIDWEDIADKNEGGSRKVDLATKGQQEGSL